MLTSLELNNYTLVDHLVLDLKAGFSVLSGETGAGKSILIGAITLALGARADKQVVRQGNDRCDIYCHFDLADNLAAQSWLDEHDYTSGDHECLIRRTVHHDGRSRLSINGQACSLTLMRQFAPLILNIHGQHQHQLLFDAQHQQQLVDRFAQTQPLLTKTKQLHKAWHELQKQLDALAIADKNRDNELAFLEFQLAELNALALQPDTWQRLSEQHRKLAHNQDIVNALSCALTTIEGEPGVLAQVQSAQSALAQIQSYTNECNNTQALLTQVHIDLEEARTELAAQLDKSDLSSEHLSELDKQLSQIHDIARKHQCEADALYAKHLSLQEKHAALLQINETQSTLKDQQNKLLVEYNKVAKSLTQKRQQAVGNITPKIEQHLHSLGMPHAHFSIELTTLPQAIHPLGHERLTFHIQTNRGQPSQPLDKIVSGGELSRLSLAIELILSAQQDTPSLIFDEVDAGIGGHTANTLGSLLKKLGEKNQVLCITHLAQVAARADQQILVQKSVRSNQTYSTVCTLSAAERLDEIVRMLGGDKDASSARDHAQALLGQSACLS